MDALLTMSLISAGGRLVNNLVNACGGTTSTTSSSSASNTSFNQVLGSEMSASRTDYSSMDTTELKTKISELETSLGKQSGVSGFIGTDSSYTVRRQGGGCVLEKEDGTLWRIPSDSEASAIAKDLCDARQALALKEGADKTAFNGGWIVTTEEV